MHPRVVLLVPGPQARAVLWTACALALSACGGDGPKSREIMPFDAQPGGADGSGGLADVGGGGVEDAGGGSPRPDEGIDATLEADATPQDAEAADAAPDAATPDPACDNRRDDDADGQTDYPNDPGCGALTDEDEADPNVAPCGNGVDDDGDGLADLDDPGCVDMSDPGEQSECAPGLEFREVTGLARVEGTTSGVGSLDATCRTNDAPEAVHLVTLRRRYAALRASTQGSAFDTVLSIRQACDDLASEVACNDDARSNERTSVAAYEAPEVGDYFVIVDGFRDAQGAYTLTLAAEVNDDEPCPPEGGLETCRLGSVCVEGVCTRAACSNRRDDDGDRKADYPNDPGCESPSDQDETNPQTPPQCSNGQDDDFNGVADFPDDPACESAADDSESPAPPCRNGLDDDGDGLIDLEDPGCRNDPEWFFEFNTALCRDGMDNDQDGRVDYPNDPGCESFEDALEDDPAVAPACANALDDDGDGQVDYPAAGRACVSAADMTELDPCLDFAPTDVTGVADYRGNLQGAAVVNAFNPTCVIGSGVEAAFVWRVAADRPLDGLQLSTRGSRAATILSARTACDAAADLDCDQRSGPNGASLIELGPQPAGTEIFIFVDSVSGSEPDLFRLRAAARVAVGGRCDGGEPWTCSDGSTCRDGVCAPAECANGLDDDGDGQIDWPLDAGCATASDDDELDPALAPECANGLDDDGNGQADYPNDPGCDARGDAREVAVCADDVDNDGDALSDFDRNGDGFLDANGDPGCACSTDASEGSDPVCFDGCDNDRDGLVDAEDPGCDGSPNDGSEFNVPQCQDGVDNDQDGATDFPNDDGCPAPTSPLERSPAVAPACSNDIDDDADGRVDFGGASPDDGCSSAADDDERGPCDVPQTPLPANGEARGTTAASANNHVPGCSRGSTAPEVVFAAFLPYPATVEISTAGSAFDTVLYARSACVPALVCAEPPAGGAQPPVGDAEVPTGDAGVDAAVADAAAPGDAAQPADDAGVPVCVSGPTELACNDDDGGGVQSRIEFDWAGGEFFVFADGFGSGSGNYQVAVTATYPEDGVCGPGSPAWASCAAGTACRAAEDDARLLCRR